MHTASSIFRSRVRVGVDLRGFIGEVRALAGVAYSYGVANGPTLVPDSAGRWQMHATGKLSWSCYFSTIFLSLHPPTVSQTIHLSSTRSPLTSTAVRRPGLGADKVCITVIQLFYILTIIRSAILGIARQGEATAKVFFS